MRAVSKIIVVTLKLLTVVFVLAYLVGVLSMWISPRTFISPAFLGLAYPLLLLIIFFLAVFWLIVARWKVSLALLLVLVFTWGAVKTYIPIHRKVAQENLPEDCIKVLSYNVMSFGFLPHTAQNPNPILQYIRNSDADIVCLQEASLYSERGKYVSMADIKNYLPAYKYRNHQLAQGKEGSGLLLLSKYPILNVKNLSLKSESNGSVAYVISIWGKEVTVINNHLESFRLTLDDGKHYLKMMKSGEAMALKRQMNAKLGLAYRRRAAQAEVVHQAIQQADKPYVLVCGDFNDTPISYVRHRIAQGLIDAYVDSGMGLGLSFNRGVYKVRIDHILCGSAFKPYNATVDNTIVASDHYPIYTYLKPQL